MKILWCTHSLAGFKPEVGVVISKHPTPILVV